MLTAIPCLLLLPASASAEPSTLSGSLSDQLQSARADLANHSSELRSARLRTGQLRSLQTQALRRTPEVRAQLQAAQADAAAAERRLNRITLAYISLVQSLGGTPGGAGSTDEQRLAQYLSDVRAGDVALVMEQGKGLLRRQQAMMDKVRQAARRLQERRRAVGQALERQQMVRWQSTSAVMENQQRIAQLRRQISIDQGRVAQLEARLGILNSSQGGSVLTGGQVMFSFYLAELSGLDVNLIKAWVLAEMSGGYATERQREGNHNWLNIGYFDALGGGGAFQDIPRVWSDPQQAAQASEAFLEGHFLGASPGIQRIIKTSGRSVETQIRAIASSGWASSGYNSGNSLRGTYRLVPKTTQPLRKKARWQSPKDKKFYTLGDGR